MDIARDDPEVLNLWIANQRSRMQQTYGVLMEQLGLTPAQREKFKDILTADAARGTDIGATASAKGLGFDDPVVKALRAESQQQAEAELAALLGEQGLNAYRDYERTTPVRGFVEGFAVQVASTAPLTRNQADQLATALIAATPVAKPDDRPDPVDVDWAKVDAAAEKFLSPTQFAAWKLGVAHNKFGSTRAEQDFLKVYRSATGKTGAN
jgi:hypothetical protein